MKSTESLLKLTGRLLLALIAGIFLLIGVVGLVLPIIPGIVFLALGAWLLTRISSRAADYVQQHAGWQKMTRWRQRTRHLNIAERCYLGVLLGCRKIVSGLQKITRL